MKIIRYNNYHKHTHYSNVSTIDSIAKPQDYIESALELGHTTYFTTEHRFGGNFLEAYDLCKENNLKMIFGVEAYYVDNRFEKDKGNYHIILIAKNKYGFKDINRIMSEANRTGFYYKPRIDLELLLSLNPKNVWITTACVAGRLFKTENYEKEFLLPVLKHFKKNFYLEVQSHPHLVQAEYNKKIIEIHNKYNIPIIHANDSHYILPSDSKDRDLFLRGKGIYYEEEDGFILDYSDTDTIFERYEQQDVLTKEQVKQALENTLIFDDAEDLGFTKEIKMPTIYPNLSLKEKHNKLKEIINNRFKEKIKNNEIDINRIDEYKEAIQYEYQIIEDTSEAKTVDYFLLNERIVDIAINKYNGILTKTGRGSCSGFYINNLLNFTNIDRLEEKIPLYPTRFMSKTRILETKSLPDIDYNTGSPEPFIKATEDLLGKDNIYYMVAYGTMKESASFRNLCRAKNLKIEEYNEVAKNIEQYKDDPKWENLIKESEKFIGVIDSVSPSPCSFLILNESISEEIGLIKVGDELCTVIDGYTFDVWKYLKEDFLTVSVWNIISETFKLINKPIPNIKELKKLLDDKVWDLYKNGLTTTLNQVDSIWATGLMKKYCANSVEDMCKFVSAIRPAFSSLLEGFLNRIDYTTGTKELDELLKSSDHYLMWQENIMQYLVWLGIEEDKTYGLIKKIAKKSMTEQELKNLKFKLRNSWIDNFGNDNNFHESWDVIEKSVKYLFNSSHGLCVAYDSLYGAYLKAHYPLEYYTVILNKYSDNTEKTDRIISELPYFNISILPIQFGKSRAEYSFDKKTNSIYKGIESIKYQNKQIAEDLYELSKSKKYSNFIDLLIDIQSKISINSRQMEILISLNYFSQFGNNQKLLNLYHYFQDLYNKKQIKKDKIIELNLSKDIVKKYSQKETEKLYKDIDIISMFKELERILPNNKIFINEQLICEFENLGYCKTIIPNLKYDVVIVLDINAKYTPRIIVYHLNNGKTETYKVSKKLFRESPIKKCDLIYLSSIEPRQKSRKAGEDKNGKPIWEKIDEYEDWITYGYVNIQKFQKYILDSLKY